MHGASDRLQKSGSSWVVPAKRLRIKKKMSAKFSTAAECFACMDKDQGGTLSRAELAVGLRAVGVWLHPVELNELLELLDKDSSGDIDLQEFEVFWKRY